MPRVLAALLLLLAGAVAPTAGSVVSRRHASLQLRHTEKPITSIPRLEPVYSVPNSIPKAPAEEKDKKESEAAPAEHAGKACASLIFLVIIFASSLYAMTQSAWPHVGNNTVLVIDNIIAIFLAVLWFQGFDKLTEFLSGHDAVMAASVHAVMLVMTAGAVAYAVRHRTTSIAIICGCGAHYCAFASAHVSLAVQAHYFNAHPWTCFFGTFAVLLALVGLGGVSYLVKRAVGIQPGVEMEDEGHNRFMERFDDVETDFAGMGLATYWVMVVQFSLLGEFPEPEIEPGSKPQHTERVRLMMAVYTVVLFVLGPHIVEKLSLVQEASYFRARILGLLTSFITMSCAFAFLTWGKMQVYEHETTNMSPIFARIMFAAMCSLLCMLGIRYIAAMMEPGAGSRASLVAVGLIAGFAWEEVFDAAIDGLIEGTENEQVAKAAIAIGCAAVILPTYSWYVKPKSMKAAEEEGG